MLKKTMNKDHNQKPDNSSYLDRQQQHPDNLVSYSQQELTSEQSERNPPNYQQEPEEIVQVVYQSNAGGSMVSVETSLLNSDSFAYHGTSGLDYNDGAQYHDDTPTIPLDQLISTSLQQSSRATSTLPSVAEESSSVAGNGIASEGYPPEDDEHTNPNQLVDDLRAKAEIEEEKNSYAAYSNLQYDQKQYRQNNVNPNAIYSTVKRQSKTGARSYAFDIHEEQSNIAGTQAPSDQQTSGGEPTGYTESADSDGAQQQLDCPDGYYQTHLNSSLIKHPVIDEVGSEQEEKHSQTKDDELQEQKTGQYSTSYETIDFNNNQVDENDVPDEDIDTEISQILARHKQGAAESGSFRNNFKKKLGVSVSTNENDLTAHRQKLLESQEVNVSQQQEDDESAGNLRGLKRNQSVSFNVHSSRGNSRHSVDIRNLPSYLSVKRASIVDVARGAMSSLMHSFGGSSSTSRRNSSIDDEPIFEEPIAPTLSLGQRVALVKNNGAEFGTVGWIGQLPEVDFDWIVGVIFDNMIGNSDGAHNGIRYFYARENYAMFVPLSTLTKTDNYIGRPETGTMLSRMSVSLKPGQLISIQRSSIRLQHCFLNAPHQRVGHDVRAVSNRLHCQCHNCGPCAHLTKQGNRFGGIPPFGAHHAPNKKNSLAHAAVEILAHHHHHYHEEEHKEEEDYQFGDNAAHACNFVRYSCCQQNGTAGHDFSSDCQMVRPELLDNLIHAPRAPHRRHRLRRARHYKNQIQQQQVQMSISGDNRIVNSNFSTLDTEGTMKSWQNSEQSRYDSGASYSSSGSSSRSSSFSDDNYNNNNSNNNNPTNQNPYQNGYQYDTLSTQQHSSTMYNTIESRMSILDQQRFIYRPESSVFQNSTQSDEYYDGQNTGLGSRIRRCLACILGGKKRKRRGPKKQKMSAKNRLIEYRRKQSTFVPSTLAKPQEDFASHGLSVPTQYDPNSDYSSYSKSSNSSPYNSPQHNIIQAEMAIGADQMVDGSQMSQSMTLQHGEQNSNEQLKSSHTFHCNPINYGYITPSESSLKKNDLSYDSADLGYYDTRTEGSNDTLKQIVDQSINEEVVQPESIVMNQNDEANISPIISNVGSDLSEQVEVSSPTASIADNDVYRIMYSLDLNRS